MFLAWLFLYLHILTLNASETYSMMAAFRGSPAFCFSCGLTVPVAVRAFDSDMPQLVEILCRQVQVDCNFLQG